MPEHSPEVPAKDNVVAPAARVEDADLRSRPEGSFRIKDSLKQIAQTRPAVKEQQQVAVQHEQVASREAFNQQQVVNALESYIGKNTPEPIISIAIKSHRPIVEGEKITVLADNQLQLDKLEAVKLQIQNFLMRTLGNGFIALNFHIFDDKNNHEKKKLFTSSDKFEHFMKLNPVVADLKVIFGLELE